MVIVDTSIWIDYFNNDGYKDIIFSLIDNGTLATNEIILTELIPSIRLRHEEALEDILKSIPLLKLKPNWAEITDIQTDLLKNGINKVGIPDIIILQNALQYNSKILSLDKHMRLAAPYVGCEFIEVKK